MRVATARRMEQAQSQAKAKVRVERMVGSLPRLWDRRAIFVANLLALFFGNRRAAEILRQEVGSIRSYGGRLVPIIDLVFRRGENLLVLDRQPDRALCRYFQDVLGLSLPKIEAGPGLSELLAQLDEQAGTSGAVKPSSPAARAVLDRLREHPAEWIDGFVTDAALARLAEATGKRLIATPEGSRNGNNKLLLHQFLVSQHLPVFDTILARDSREVRAAARDLAKLGYSGGVVKSQLGASGIGMTRIWFDRNIDLPDYLFHEGTCLVQGWLTAAPGIEWIGSPSVQMFLSDDEIMLYDLTEQFLSPDSIHEGNTAPPPFLAAEPDLREELLRQGEIVARWLRESGYRGTASADFHIIRRCGRFEVRVCEINARITGATYPALLARFFRPRGAWLMRNVRFDQPSSGRIVLDALETACLLFRPETGRGILPINFNTGDDGRVVKGQFVAISRTAEDVRRLFSCVENLDSVLWEYDRD